MSSARKELARSMSTAEAHIVQRAIQRDCDAFAELYNDNVDRIYRYIYYRVGNGAEAEDLCEQVFLKAWEAIGRFEWRGYPFSSWLYRLAHNIIIDHYRMSRESEPLEDRMPSSDRRMDPEAYLQQTLTHEQLLWAFRQLTEEQRQVLHLKFIEGYANYEIASILDKKEGAVRALQYRGLRSLNRILSREERNALDFDLSLAPVEHAVYAIQGLGTGAID
jgi:RNA polymerase sigma-70 factor, ECF subfamily